MSMITSCPSCGTMFRVVPDQLKISEGWVRCGHCAEVFDASAHLSDESILDAPAPEDVRQVASPPTMPAELPATIPAELPRPAPERPRRAEPPPRAEPPRRAEPPLRAGELRRRSEPPPPPVADDRSSESSSFFGAESQALEPSPLDTPFVFRPSDMARESISPVFPEDGRHEVQVPFEDEDPGPNLERVSFVRQARRRAFWRRPTVRILMSLVSLALAALLVLQLAYQDRNRLALLEPALQPALERMCEVLQCTLGAPRQIESIVVESSGFNRLRNDTFRLAFTLRNTARMQVAAPAIELTITDAQDQPIARRVLTPADLGAGEDVIAPGTEWTRAVGLVVTAPAAGRVAGYRLLAFYP
jgi:predicted Zn finger-like uncharacterized protein